MKGGKFRGFTIGAKRREDEKLLHFALIGGDTAPSKAFATLEVELKKRGHSVTSQLLYGDGRKADFVAVEAAVNESDVVLVGLSAFENEQALEKRAISRALKQKKPWGAYADTNGAYSRVDFKEILPFAQFMFVVDSIDANDTKEAYPHLEAIVSGNPDYDTYFFPTVTREEVRRKIGIADEELMILVPGVKEPTADIVLLSEVVDAILYDRDHPSEKKFVLLYCPHPGDLKNPQALAYNVSGFEKYVQCPQLRFAVNVPEWGYNGNQLLVGADMVITPMCSLLIGAACRRLPVIGWINTISTLRQEAINGRDIWPPMKFGLGPLVWSANLEMLVQELNKLLGYAHYREGYRKRQEYLYPTPERPGLPVEKMATYLEEVAGRVTV